MRAMNHSAPRENRPRPSAVRHVTVDARSDGQRLDNFLLREIGATSGQVPRSLIYRKLRKGEVRVNGKRAKPTTRLTSGDEVRIPPINIDGGQKRAAAQIPAGWLERVDEMILHEDDALLVVNKPAGLAVHGGTGIPFGLVDLVRARFPDAPMLELVHRIDRETSGIVLLARSLEALRELQRQFRPEGEAKKEYELMVHGRWPKRLTTVDTPLRKWQGEGAAHRVQVDDDGKPAVTHFHLLASDGRTSRLRARLETGRTHQIRVHAASVGHPLVGDQKYGDRQLDRTIDPKQRPALMLHAAQLTIRHPVSDITQRYAAPLPTNWPADPRSTKLYPTTMNTPTNLNRPRMIIFDWDGTLAQSTGRIVQAFERSIDDLGLPPLDEARIRGIIGLGLPEAIHALYPDADAETHAALADRYRYHYFTDESPLETYEGAAELLESLTGAGCWLAIATGKSRRGLDAALEKTGLGNYFLGSRTADETASKPAPVMLNSLLDEFGLMPQEAWMVGDTDFDILMAHNAGCSPIAITHGAHERDRLAQARPHAWVEQLAEIGALYRRYE